MAWVAKPSGGYALGSDEWKLNAQAFYEFANSLGFSIQAISGMIGNSQHEGGMNPWRWQSDKVNLSAGYGLFQYTTASGYIDNYGKNSTWYAPNLSTNSVTSGALASDGNAQIEVIGISGKYNTGKNGWRIARITPYYKECTNYQTLDDFKKINDVYGATVCWLGFFESPKVVTQDTVNVRYSSANYAYDYLKGLSPTPPTPTPASIYFIPNIRKRRNKR